MSYRFCGCLLSGTRWNCTAVPSRYTPDDGRRDRPKHVECCSKNKINLRYCASGWFYYRNRNIKRHIQLKCLFLLQIIARRINFHHVPRNKSKEQSFLQQITIANHEISYILWNPKIHNSVNKSRCYDVM